MSDFQRRLMCRLLFFCACVIPTVIVIQWILSPSTNSQWEARIKSSLGIVTSIAEVRTPLPQETILENVKIMDAKNKPMLELGAVTFANTEKARQIVIQKFDASNLSMAQIVRKVHGELSQPPYPARPYKIYFGELQLTTENMNRDRLSQSLYGVSVDILPTANSLEMTMKFRLSLAQDAKSVQLAYSRRLDSKPEETWAVISPKTELPTWLLAEIVPELKCLGTTATFTGLIQLSKDELAWQGVADGILKNVDLFHLVYQPFDQWAFGTADVQVHCDFHDNKIQTMSGKFVSVDGQIGTTLLNSLASHLQMDTTNTNSEEFMTEYNQMRFDFRIDGAQLTIKGDSGGNILYSKEGRQLLIVDNGAKFQVSELVNALGDHQTSVPISARSMTKFLHIMNTEGTGLLEFPIVGQRDEDNGTFFK